MATSEYSLNKRAVLVQIYGEAINKKFPLNGSVVHVGRALNSHIRVNALSVSRMHCSLKKELKGWTVTDCGSQNGTYVNGQLLRKDECMNLQFSDIIFLGPPTDNPIAFCFEESFDASDFTSEPFDDEEFQVISTAQVSNSTKESQSQNAAAFQNSHMDSNRNLTLSNDLVPTTQQMHNIASSSTNNELKKEKRSKKKAMKRPSAMSYSESQEHGKKKDKGSELIINNQDDDENSQSLLDVDSDMLDIDVHSTHQEFNNFISSIPDKNVSEYTGDHKSTKAQESNGDDLKSRLAVLSKEIEKLEKSKSDLLKEYAAACEKNKLLDQQLTEQKKFTEDMHMYKQRLKNKFKNQIMGQLEEDLICNICTEFLIKPTVLDCSHTFCEYCIKEWKRKKKQCPVCRSNIQSETRVLALDHFIDKTLETLTPEQKESRRQLISQREQKKALNSTPTGKRKKRRRSVHSRPPRHVPASPNDIQVQLMFSIAPVTPPAYRNSTREPLAGTSNVNLVPEIILSDDGISSDDIDF